MGRVKGGRIVFSIFLSVLLGCFILSSLGLAQEEKEKKGPQPQGFNLWRWLKNHPLADGKFAFFIFCLIPVQTLFAHNWLTLPVYVERAYRGSWIGRNFEAATNFNPLLIFFFVPIVVAHNAYFSTFSGISGVHPGHVHGFGGGAGGFVG
jgi:hypothetical protein